MKFRSKNDSQDRRRPPNYFSRSVQVRVLMMVFSLMLVIVLMFEARKPENWKWLWAGTKSRVPTMSNGEDIDTRLSPEPPRQEDPLGTVYANASKSGAVQPASTTDLRKKISAVENDEDARQRIQRDAWRGFLNQLGRDQQDVLTRILRYSRGGPELSADDLGRWPSAFSQLDQLWKDYLTSAIDAVLVASDELPVEQRTQLLNVLRDLEVEWTHLLGRALRAVLDDRPWTELEREALVELQATLDELALAAVRDDMVWRPEEQNAWFRSFEKLMALTDQDLNLQSLGNVGFVQLFRQTKEYRGQLVTISGTAELAYYVSAPKNDLGIGRYYIFWLRPGDGSDAPIVAYALELPDGFPKVGSDHTILREEMTFTGYFFKRWAYGARDGIRTAPLVLAKRPTWQPTPTPFSAAPPSLGVMAAAVLAIALLAIAIARWVYNSSNSRSVPRNATLAELTPNQFAAMAERKIGPTITEALRQRSEHEKED